jgi:spore germination cell wall hydrolase CwlJ-like protein
MTSEKIKRIRLHKLVGKIVYGLILATLIIVILINLNCAMKTQAQTYNAPEKAAQTSEKELTPTERDLIERVVAAESRGESLKGQMAVAQVIKDRTELWGMTIVEVVLEPYQFAKPYEGEISDKTKLAVSNVFDLGQAVWEDPTTYFHSGDDPYWASEKISRGSVGGHKFYGGET